MCVEGNTTFCYAYNFICKFVFHMYVTIAVAMDGNYRCCYVVGYTLRHRERRGKLFRFPRNPVQSVHKIIEWMYDHLFACHSTHFRCQTKFINFHILNFVWSLNAVSCIIIRVAAFVALYNFCKWHIQNSVFN